MTDQLVLVTGAAGFIGFHLSRRLLNDGYTVVGIDNLNTYYDVKLKHARLAMLQKNDRFSFRMVDIADRRAMEEVFGSYASSSPNTNSTLGLPLDYVIHLAAQVGVRYSVVNPYAYVDSNINGFLNVLEGCRCSRVRHLVFASSSSVYGANTKIPFSVHDNVDHPVSLYAATKKANELMAHTYASIHGLPCTGLRFFTVYGPWGRPDMSYSLFAKAIFEEKPIDVFNQGKMKRDFTYVDDVVETITRIMNKCPEPSFDWDSDCPDPGTSNVPYRIYNVGNNKPVELIYFIEIIEKYLKKTAIKNFMPMQPGDMQTTSADIEDLLTNTGFRPQKSIEDGLKLFIDWYLSYYG